MKRQRLLGQEVEYAILIVPHGKEEFLTDSIRQDNIIRHLLNSINCSVIREPTHLWGQFLPNGARFYFDTGGHPEYATPECLGPKQLVCAAQAGDRFLERLQKRANELIDARETLKYRICLYKNNNDETGQTWGCHENYLVKPDLFTELIKPVDVNALMAYFITYFITSIIYTGNGHVRMGFDNRLHFCMSQRAEHIMCVVNNLTTSNRPIICTKDEPHANKEYWRRLHLIGRDSNMSPLATYLKFGTCSIILDILESAPHLFKEEWILKDPIHALSNISWDANLRKQFKCLSGSMYTALEIQKMFCEISARYVEQNGSEEDKEVVSRWQEVLDALSKDQAEPGLLVGKIDWITKKAVIEKKLRKISGIDYGNIFEIAGRFTQKYKIKDDEFVSLVNLAKTINLQYHDIRRDKGIFYRFLGENDEDSIVTEDEVELLIEEPPSGIRPELRGFLIKELRKNSFWRRLSGKRYSAIFDWGSCVITKSQPAKEDSTSSSRNGEDNVLITFLDPYERRLLPMDYGKLMSLGIIDELPERFRPVPPTDGHPSPKQGEPDAPN